jgi:hypothetical protein
MDVKGTDCENVNWIHIFDCSVLLSFVHVILHIHQHSFLVVCLGSFVDGTVRIKETQVSEYRDKWRIFVNTVINLWAP